MDKMTDLVEQHILESESRLRRIDELLARARTVPHQPPATGLLQQIETDRAKLARELDEVRALPRGAEAVRRGEGVKGMLGSVGLQLEQALGAIFERDK
jgi:hypothetical protein